MTRVSGEPTSLEEAKNALREAEHALTKALEQKAKLENKLNEWTRSFAHDIKNALGPVVGYSQLLQGTFLAPEKHNKYLKVVNSSALKAVDLCNEMLNLNFDAQEQSASEFQVVNVADVIEEVVEQFCQIALERY